MGSMLALLVVALVGVAEGRTLATLDCKGNLNLFDPGSDDVALTVTGVDSLLTILRSEQASRLAKCCRDSPSELIQERADFPGTVVAALTGAKKTFAKDRCLDSSTPLSADFLKDVAENAGTTGKRALQHRFPDVDVAVQVAGMQCSDGSPAMGIFCEGSGCNVRWCDGGCPQGYKCQTFQNLGDGFKIGNEGQCGMVSAMAWRVLSRFLGRQVRGVCLPDFGDGKAEEWDGGDAWGMLENGVHQLGLGKAQEIKLGCNDVLQTAKVAVRAKGLGKMVQALAKEFEECTWSGASSSFMLVNGVWQPGMWLNGLFTNPSGKPHLPWGDKCGMGKYLFEGCGYPPKMDMTLEGTSTLNYQTWATEGFVGAEIPSKSGKVLVGVEKCENTPYGLPAISITGDPWCETDADCLDGMRCFEIWNLDFHMSSSCPSTEEVMDAVLRRWLALVGIGKNLKHLRTCIPKKTGPATWTREMGLKAASRDSFSFETPAEAQTADEGMSSAVVALIVLGVLVTVVVVSGVGFIVWQRKRANSINMNSALYTQSF